MDAPTVTIKQGQLRGYVRTDIDGGPIFSFLGIPYGKPPVGDLRFKAPLPAESWTGIRDATQEGDKSYQRDLLLNILVGSEDCLNLNVFTKTLNSNDSLRPVMVWIHGGAFVSGSNTISMYGPEFLLTQDVVLVSINYRLGALGFLSSEDVSLGVPGNAGLKDQALALKWVRENIQSFNGDPDNVTIFGESAGSSSVHHQVLSPTTKGLFHKAILQSGTALNNWSRGRPVIKDLAKLLGHDTDNEKEALDILRKVSVDKLHEVQEKIEERKTLSGKVFFAPVIEKPNETAFLTEDPINIIKSGSYNKVPLMIGYNTNEGLLLAITEMKAREAGKPVQEGPPNFEDAIPWQVDIERQSEISRKVSEKIQKMYFRDADHKNNFYFMCTDALFVAAIIASAKNHAETSDKPVYLYRMSLDAGLNLLKKILKTDAPGACHADDLGYLFKNMLTPPLIPGSVEEVSVRRFVKLWTNFAKYGNPTPDDQEFGIQWEPIENGKVNFIDIGEELTIHHNPELERLQLWREIYGLHPNTANFL